jgi:DNA invertase Pin-like site-specific DNA recombinase
MAVLSVRILETRVYMRQSSLGQVIHNQESTRRQYALADRARELGFQDIGVIDDGLGRTGSGLMERPGFQRLVGEACTGEVGAIFCIEAPRLTRNGRDWHHLIELCGMVGAVVIDPEGVYDPALINRRLLLGLKGTTSEFELNLLRQRSVEAIRRRKQCGPWKGIGRLLFLTTHIVPVGLYIGCPTQEAYRPLAGGLTYRYFMPVRERYWWLGTTSHLESNALMLARFSRIVEDRSKLYVELAYRQLEWIMGANPFGSCLMIGEGFRNPLPFSIYVGTISGGIVNGIGGNVKDEPVLNHGTELDWRTCEYWSPHTAYYLWAQSVLEGIAS